MTAMRRASTRALAALVLALASTLIYAPSLRAPFVFDDLANIRDNGAIRRLWPLWSALNPPPVNMTYCTRPFVNLTMCADYAVSGLNPLGYRLSNLALHAAATLALWDLLRRILARSGFESPDTTAFVAALLWGVHPLNTSAVSYLSQRGELCVGLFFFLMLYALDRAVADKPPGENASRTWLLLSFLASLLGMGSKESMAAAPLLALWYDRHFLSSSWRDVFRRRGLFHAALAATLAWPVYRQWVFSPHLQPGILDLDTAWRYWLTQAWGLARLLRLAFWPAPLIFDYGTALVSGPAEVGFQVLLTLALVGTVLWAALRAPRLAFAGLCFFGLLAPSLLVPITGQPVAEHRMYAPLASVVAFWVAGLAAFRPRWTWTGHPARAGWMLIAVLLAGASLHRNMAYRTGRALMEDVLRKRPGNSRAWYNLGVVQQEAGRLDEAEASYSRALALHPSDTKALSNRALIRFQRGRGELALDDLHRWLQIEPNSAEALARRAAVWQGLGDASRAAADYDAALGQDRLNATHLNNLAWLLATSKTVRDPGRAVELAAKAAELGARNHRFLDTLAVAHAAAGDFESARRVLHEALDKARAEQDAALVSKLEQREACFRENRPWEEGP